MFRYWYEYVAKIPKSISDVRPIAHLSVLSKIFGKIIHNQLQIFLETPGSTYKRQSEYRRGLSTQTCLIDYLDYVKKSD